MIPPQFQTMAQSEHEASPQARYGQGTQAFHWASAILIIILVSLGLYCSWLEDGPRRSWLLNSWHKPLGLLVILLTIARLTWKALQPKVDQAEGLTFWESWLSRLTHWALYVILFAMPLSGLLMSEGGGRPTNFFNLFQVPQIIALDPALKPRDQYWYIVGKLLHVHWLEWSLYVLVALHVAGALKHRFIDRNRTYFLRMWDWRRGTGRPRSNAQKDIK